MTTNSDGEAEWARRIGYTLGLTSADPGERAIALARLAAAREGVNEALARFNEGWFQARDLGRLSGWYQEPETRRLLAANSAAQRHAFPDALWNRPHGPLTDWPGLPYALQFLEWEARFPREWTLHAKKWGTKQDLIRDLARDAHRGAVRARLVRLVTDAVARAYRCKDREYVRIARAVDGDDLRTALATAADSDNPWARLHAGYVLRLLNDPTLPNSRRTWQIWCERAE
ncbi:hypothetical protein ACFQS3_10675 [Glycomyces mayteni]|uniref:Uncharacterized protein n=1 Tax=Glycomyces mayteni TaxID=543887 RepID=A0ABW2D5P8_9ACTN|nr:hypothetical protein GCM10025732_31520 [Glycomyces mayteni]